MPDLPPSIQTACVSYGERPELSSALAFTEGVVSGGLTRETLESWVERHLVSPGLMVAPAVVLEHGAGAICLSGRRQHHTECNGLLRVAFDRVVGAMRGLLASPQDDRFVTAAIHGDRVRRDSSGGACRWVARPSDTHSLSDIVLSLFAVDVLHHRETYDIALSVCDDCGRIGFDEASWMRRTCFAHRDEPGSGVRTAGTLRDQGQLLAR